MGRSEAPPGYGSEHELYLILAVIRMTITLALNKLTPKKERCHRLRFAKYANFVGTLYVACALQIKCIMSGTTLPKLTRSFAVDSKV